VKIQVEIFWDVTPCSVVVGYQSFGGQFWRWRQHGLPKHWYPTTTLHDVISQKISTWIWTWVSCKIWVMIGRYVPRLVTRLYLTWALKAKF